MGLVNRGWSLPEERRTIVDELNDAGYETAHFGLQHERHSAAANRYQIEGYHSAEDVWVERAVAGAVDFLARRADSSRPFYLNIGTVEVHESRWQGTKPLHRRAHYGVDPPHEVYVPPFIPDFPPIRAALGQFQGAIRFLDIHVQTLFDAIARLGYRENTLVVFTTDHGIAVPRAKTTLYDRGTETALMMQLPGTIGRAREIPELIQNIDLAPTLLEAAGAAIPPRVQGRSFWPLLTGRAYAPHEALFTERNWHAAEYDPMRAVRAARFHYIRNFGERPLRHWLPREVTHPPPTYRASYTELWPERTQPRPAEELYDVAADPEEFVNLADDERYRSVKQNLAAALESWMRRTADPVLEGPIPDKLNPWPVEADTASERG
jgi:arylsulfatase A-like enzyme